MSTKRLLVLDLNGTILHRLTHAFEFKLFKAHPIVLATNLKTDITVHGCKIVFRPHATNLLTFLLKHFDVAVWTSSRPKNALPMVHQAFKNLLDFACILEEAQKRNVTVRQVVLGPSDKGAQAMKEQLLEQTKDKARLKFIWTQSECDTVPLEDKKNDSDITEAPTKSSFTKPIRKKNLTKIYETFPDRYSPSNTLIIDDTTAKLQDHVQNHLQIEEFNVTDHETDFTEDRNLLRLKKYLERLINEDPEDLRSFLFKYDLNDF